jgi:hypothetical protein
MASCNYIMPLTRALLLKLFGNPKSLPRIYPECHWLIGNRQDPALWQYNSNGDPNGHLSKVRGFVSWRTILEKRGMRRGILFCRGILCEGRFSWMNWECYQLIEKRKLLPRAWEWDKRDSKNGRMHKKCQTEQIKWWRISLLKPPQNREGCLNASTDWVGQKLLPQYAKAGI